MTQNVPTLASVEVSPAEVPPAEVPPAEVPPAEVPPAEVPASPPLAFGDVPSDEHANDEARTIEEIRVGRTEAFIDGAGHRRACPGREGSLGFCDSLERLFKADVPICIEPGSRDRTHPMKSGNLSAIRSDGTSLRRTNPPPHHDLHDDDRDLQHDDDEETEDEDWKRKERVRFGRDLVQAVGLDPPFHAKIGQKWGSPFTRPCVRLRHPPGAVAQLGERMTGSHEVRGSIPLGST